MNSNRKGKEIGLIKIILSFFLAIAFYIFIVCIEFSMGMLNPSVFRNSMLESKYIKSVSEQMSEEINSLLKEKGIPESVSKSLMNDEDLYIVIKNGIENALENENHKYVEEAVLDFEEQWKEGMNQYLKGQDIYMTDQVDEAVDEVVSYAVGIYSKYIQPYMVQEYYQFRSDYLKKCIAISLVSLIIVIVCISFIFVMSKYKHQAVRTILYSNISVFIWNSLSIYYILSYIKSVDKTIFPEYYSNFLQEYLNNFMFIWYIISVALLLLTISMFIFVIRLKHKN